MFNHKLGNSLFQGFARNGIVDYKSILLDNQQVS